MSSRNFWSDWFPSPKKLQKRIDALTAELIACQEHCAQLEADTASKAKSLEQHLARLESESVAKTVANERELTRLEAEAAVKAEAAERHLARLESESAAKAVANERELTRLKTEAAAIEQRIARTEAELETLHPAHSLETDAFYAAFEARFRGSRDAIMERQSYYLPHITQARTQVAAGMPSAPPPLQGPYAALFESLRAKQGVLDLGSGRGEWLELLRREGILAVGVELNQIFLEHCQKTGLQVIASDVIECLKAAPSDSVAVVTGFHIIEHLPFPVLQEFVRQSFRILRPGGIAIFETPNPRNIQVGAHNFWSDPTHLHPAHPEFTQFLLEKAGFAPVRLEYLTPYPPEFHVGQPDDSLAQRFNELFYGPQDFAVIGTKS